jgi:hypothetical protein
MLPFTLLCQLAGSFGSLALAAVSTGAGITPSSPAALGYLPGEYFPAAHGVQLLSRPAPVRIMDVSGKLLADDMVIANTFSLALQPLKTTEALLVL